MTHSLTVDYHKDRRHIGVSRVPDDEWARLLGSETTLPAFGYWVLARALAELHLPWDRVRHLASRRSPRRMTRPPSCTACAASSREEPTFFNKICTSSAVALIFPCTEGRQQKIDSR